MAIRPSSLFAIAGIVLLSVQPRAQQAPVARSSKGHPSAPKVISKDFDPGSVADGTYRNVSFGFSYKIPVGWVERTAEMQEDSTASKPEDAGSRLLLSVFERPPETSGDTVNSAVVIAAESVAAYPGLKTAADYFVPLEEVVKSKDFKVMNEPHEFPLGTRKIAREDFSKDLGKLTMHQSSLVILLKNYVISFTFIAGSDDDLDQLIEGLNFVSSSHAIPSSSAQPKK